jgi:predicted RNA-binding protein with TRAM domain
MEELEEGDVLNIRIIAKNTKGEGIGKVGESFVFVKNCDKIGKEYKVKIVKKYRTYAVAEPLEEKKEEPLVLEKENFKNENLQI